MVHYQRFQLLDTYPDSKVHGAIMGPTWVLSAPDGPMLATWILLSGYVTVMYIIDELRRCTDCPVYSLTVAETGICRES